MQSNGSSLLTRQDTFFGVCEGLGEDLGIHSNLIRLTFAGLLFWNPVAALISYVAAGLFVATLRWIVPNAPAAETSIPAPEQALQDDAAPERQLPLAA
jgi:phage shock protein PspC (stress-responsive transcriptional regulator)